MAKKTAKFTLARALPNIKVKNLLVPCILIATLIILGLFKNQFIVASVNGKQITRLELIKKLEKRDGKTMLDNLIIETLILQEAENRKVNVGNQEVDGEIKKIEKNFSDQGQNLDQLLALQNLSLEELKNQIRIQLILKKLVGDVKVTNQEIGDYIEKNKDLIPKETSPEKARGDAKKQLEDQKINEKVQALIKDLQQKAKIEYLLKL